jgi:hypothetical protein
MEMLAQSKRQTRETKPRYDQTAGAASWLVTAVEDGQLTRGRLAVCRDGRVYLGSQKLRPTETLSDENERLFVGNRPLTGQAVTVLVKDSFYQTLVGMVA